MPVNSTVVSTQVISILTSKPLKLTLKRPDGKELSLEASNETEIYYMMQKAQELLKSSAG